MTAADIPRKRARLRCWRDRQSHQHETGRMPSGTEICSNDVPIVQPSEQLSGLSAVSNQPATDSGVALVIIQTVPLKGHISGSSNIVI